MDLNAIVQSIEAEISRLEKARALLTGHTAPLKRGFPPSEPTRKRNRIGEAEGARMAAAQKARWAKVKRKR
jgi:hypothetical protein